jgi:hypothetical protein
MVSQQHALLPTSVGNRTLAKYGGESARDRKWTLAEALKRPKNWGIVAQIPTCSRHEMHIANTPRLQLCRMVSEKEYGKMDTSPFGNGAEGNNGIQMTESKIGATDRLRKEGRWEEASLWRDEKRKQLRADGKHNRAESNAAAWDAMIEQFRPLPPSKKTSPTPFVRDPVFEEKFLELPMSCPVKDLLDWIGAHSAMRRLRKNGGKRVRLTVSDLKGAPSRIAVNELQCFANMPEKFFDRILDMRVRG